MPPRLKTEAEKQKLRSLIMDTARELFVKQGVDAVTMREVAKRIGYSATSIYLHFEDKEQLLRAICEEDFIKLADTLKLALDLSDPLDRLIKLGQGYVKFALSYPNHYRLMFMTPRPQCEFDDCAIERNNPEQDAYFQLKDAVDRAYHAKLYQTQYQDSELIAQTIWAAIHGLCALQITMANDTWIDWRPFEARVDAMMAMMMYGHLKEKNE